MRHNPPATKNSNLSATVLEKSVILKSSAKWYRRLLLQILDSGSYQVIYASPMLSESFLRALAPYKKNITWIDITLSSGVTTLNDAASESLIICPKGFGKVESGTKTGPSTLLEQTLNGTAALLEADSPVVEGALKKFIYENPQSKPKKITTALENPDSIYATYMPRLPELSLVSMPPSVGAFTPYSLCLARHSSTESFRKYHKPHAVQGTLRQRLALANMAGLSSQKCPVFLAFVYRGGLLKAHSMPDEDLYIKELVSLTPLLGRILQGRVSSGIATFAPRFFAQYKLLPYVDSRYPCVFFGWYQRRLFRRNNKRSSHDHIEIIGNKSLSLVVWGGTDIQTKMKFLPWHFFFMRRKENLFHIAISDQIAADLEKVRLPYRQVVFSLADSDMFLPQVKGRAVYAYTSATRPEVYGQSLIEEIKRRLPEIRFIESHVAPVSHDEMPSVYAQAFIGLRLTRHDGNANTVQELGLMGIPCVHNSELPNALSWDNVGDVVAHIRRESNNIGTKDLRLAAKTRSYLDAPTDWLLLSKYSSQ